MDGSNLANTVLASLVDDAQLAPQRRELARTRPSLFCSGI